MIASYSLAAFTRPLQFSSYVRLSSGFASTHQRASCSHRASGMIDSSPPVMSLRCSSPLTMDGRMYATGLPLESLVVRNPARVFLNWIVLASCPTTVSTWWNTCVLAGRTPCALNICSALSPLPTRVPVLAAAVSYMSIMLAIDARPPSFVTVVSSAVLSLKAISWMRAYMMAAMRWLLAASSGVIVIPDEMLPRCPEEYSPLHTARRNSDMSLSLTDSLS